MLLVADLAVAVLVICKILVFADSYGEDSERAALQQQCEENARVRKEEKAREASSTQAPSSGVEVGRSCRFQQKVSPVSINEQNTGMSGQTVPPTKKLFSAKPSTPTLPEPSPTKTKIILLSF